MRETDTGRWRGGGAAGGGNAGPPRHLGAGRSALAGTENKEQTPPRRPYDPPPPTRHPKGRAGPGRDPHRRLSRARAPAARAHACAISCRDGRLGRRRGRARARLRPARAARLPGPPGRVCGRRPVHRRPARCARAGPGSLARCRGPAQAAATTASHPTNPLPIRLCRPPVRRPGPRRHPAARPPVPAVDRCRGWARVRQGPLRPGAGPGAHCAGGQLPLVLPAAAVVRPAGPAVLRRRR